MIMTFEEWFENNKKDIVSNCENRMDEHDARDWLEDAFNAGWNSSNKYSGRSTDETTKA
jgi:hypothetical protein